MRLILTTLGLGVVLCVPFLLWGEDFTGWFSGASAVEWIRGWGSWGWLAVVGLLVADVVLPIPATPVMSAAEAVVAMPATASTAAALAIVADMKHLSVRALQPEQMGIEARALRAAGRVDEAAAVELGLRARFPEHALAR